jgi:acyl-CoA synthetase (AMP-forming)/AMP-acid ligase II
MSFIARMLGTNCRHAARTDAIVWPGGLLSWADVGERATSLAAGLLDRGLVPGDRVAVVSDNRPEMLECYYAAAMSGLVIAPVSTRLHQAELDKYFGGYVQPRAAILGPGSVPAMDGWMGDCDMVVTLPGGPDTGAAGSVLTYDALLEAGRAGGAPGAEVDPDAPFTIGQTSGTTGAPKGAVITQRSAAAAIFSFLAENPIQQGDTYLIQHPMSNVPGGPGQLFPLPKGARTAILPRFEPTACLEAIQRYRATHTVLVPTMLHDLLRHPDRDEYDTSSLRTVVVGASPIPGRLLDEAVSVFGEIFRPMYGMTESTSVASVLRPDHMYPVREHPADRFLSAGTPSAGVEVRVVDESGGEVPWDGAQVGEILLRGDNVVRRYWGDVPENETGWSEGWFHTGDAAVVDVDGFLRIVDRKRDIIISGGTNVASREVEEALGTHSDVDQVAVIGLPHERWGEAVTAVVVRRSGSTVTAEDLIAHCRRSLGGPKIPKAVHFAAALPMNNMGKVLKRELRRQWSED